MYYIIGIFLVLGVAKILALPLKWLIRLAVNGVCGMLLLILTNWILSYWSLSIDITPLRAVAAGFFGIPAIAVMVLYRVLR